MSNMNITYKVDIIPTAEQIIELCNNAGLPRPTHDPERIKKMFENSKLELRTQYTNLVYSVLLY
jgi:hypothetical protein